MPENLQDYLLGLAFWGSVIALTVAFDFAELSDEGIRSRLGYAPRVVLEDNKNNLGLAVLGIILLFILAKPTGMLLGLLARA